MQTMPHAIQQNGMSAEQSYNPQPQRMPQPPLTSLQQLGPLIMPGHAAWPSLLTNPTTTTAATTAPPNYPAPPVAIPPAPPMVKGNGAKLPSVHPSPSPRKTLTDSDRRRMCQYHEDNPSVKQTEIGAMFGVERSTVSKVLRQREKYLFPEDRSLSPVKRAKGKFPDIDRALANWVRHTKSKGIPISDDAIEEKARFFAISVGNNESHLKLNSTTWLEKFKQKNGLGSHKITRRASETNISESSLHPDSRGGSASQTPSGISPTSPNGLSSPSPLSATKSNEDLKSESLNNYLEFGQRNGFRHSNSQSTTSLNSAFTDTAPSSFSGGPTSPTTPFAFSPDNNSSSWLPSQQARVPQPPNNMQRPRSQTFPTLGIDPSYISTHLNEPLTPKYTLPSTAPSSALDSPIHDMPQNYTMDTSISSPPLHHSSSNSSLMGPPSSTTPINGLQSPPSSSVPGSPTQDDARRALDTLLSFFSQAPTGLVDENEIMTVLKLTEKLRIQQNNNTTLPGGLHRIAEQECELPSSAPTKMEEEMSSTC